MPLWPFPLGLPTSPVRISVALCCAGISGAIGPGYLVAQVALVALALHLLWRVQ